MTKIISLKVSPLPPAPKGETRADAQLPPTQVAADLTGPEWETRADAQLPPTPKGETRADDHLITDHQITK